jgi:hypothetical protein
MARLLAIRYVTDREKGEGSVAVDYEEHRVLGLRYPLHIYRNRLRPA